MVAWKVFLTVGILAVIVTSGVFYFIPDYRPKMVQSWILNARGYGPAKTPDEALAKFKKAVKARDYETAALFCTAEYAQQMHKCARQARELGQSIDDLTHTIQNVAKIDTPRGLYTLALLEPFPPDFTYEIKNRSEGAQAVEVHIVLDDAKVSKSVSESELTIRGLRLDNRIQRTLLPRIQDLTRAVALREVGMDVQVKPGGDKEKVWKIDFPVTSAYSVKLPNGDVPYPGMPESVDFLQKNGGKYAEALDGLKGSLKKDAETRSNFENELRKELNEVDGNKER
jgi:hypothetical protein